MLLAFDTATPQVTVALLDSTDVVAEHVDVPADLRVLYNGQLPVDLRRVVLAHLDLLLRGHRAGRGEDERSDSRCAEIR